MSSQQEDGNTSTVEVTDVLTNNNTIGKEQPLQEAADLNGELFPRQTLNPGFVPPSYMMNVEELASVRPPPVVQGIEDRIAELSETEKEALEAMREHRDENEWDPKEVDDWMLLRYLIAREWKTHRSQKMISKTMEWRKTTDTYTVKCTRCLDDPSAHMMQFVGWDLLHRPVVYTSHRWGRERHNVEENVAHVIETYNHVEKLMPVGVGQWIACVDFVTYSHWTDGRSKCGKEVIHMLQDHYPERLAMQILIDPPTLFWVLWKVLSVFIDAKTKTKVRFWYTAQEPKICDEFPKIFPPHLASYLIETFNTNKILPKKEK